MWVVTTPLNYSPISFIKHCHHDHHHCSFRVRIRCSGSQAPNPRGFGSQDDDDDSNVKKKDQKSMLLQQSKSPSKQSSSMPGQAPGVSSKLEKKSNVKYSDLQFEQKLQAVKRSALEKKKTEVVKEFGAIDYDAPIEPKQKSIGLGTKIGVGIAVAVFGLVFALGDFLPSGSINSSKENGAVSKVSKEQMAALESRLQEYEATLKTSPRDAVALEGAAVTLAELGEYDRAAKFLEDLTKEKPSDPDVFRLLGDVKYELKDYEASAAAYKDLAKVSKTVNFEALRGLTSSLLAAKKPDEAVQVLLVSRERLSKEKLTDSSNEAENVDPIQVELLLGKAYSDWGHISDAVSVYDQLISSHPNDFRGYLAKGILLKENGKVGEAERMFIQARFFAPEKAKALVDRYSRN